MGSYIYNRFYIHLNIYLFIPRERPVVAVCHSSAAVAAGQHVPLKWERRHDCGDIYWLGALPWGATIQQLSLSCMYPPLTPHLDCQTWFLPCSQDTIQELPHYWQRWCSDGFMLLGSSDVMMVGLIPTWVGGGGYLCCLFCYQDEIIMEQLCRKTDKWTSVEIFSTDEQI